MSVIDDFQEWLLVIFWDIMYYIGKIIDAGVTSITGFVGSIITQIVGIFRPVETLISNVITDTALLLTDAYNWLKDQAGVFTGFVTDTFNAVTDELTNIYNSITSWLDDLYGQMTDWLTSISNEIKGYFDMGYELLMSFFKDQWQEVSNFMTLIKDTIVDGFNDTLRWIFDSVQDAFDTVKNAFSDLSGWMSALWESFKFYVSDIVESFEASISDVVNVLIDFIERLWTDLMAYIDSLTDYTQEQLESFIESAMTAQMNIMKKLAVELG